MCNARGYPAAYCDCIDRAIRSRWPWPEVKAALQRGDRSILLNDAILRSCA